MSDSCLFCRIVRREIPAAVVAETDAVLAFRDVNPQAPLHALVIPKRHVASLADADDAALLGALSIVAAQVARDAGVRGVGLPHRGEHRPRRRADRPPPAPARPRRTRPPLAARLTAARARPGAARASPPEHPPVSQLHDRLHADLTAARRAQDKSAVLVLGTILSDVNNRRIELRRDPNDDDVVEVLRRGIKRRRESVEMYAKGGRDDLRDREAGEIAVLEQYLPPAVDEAELRAAVEAAVDAGAAQIGAVMARVLPQYKGRVEGSVINRLAREVLAARAG
jgi:uncharacterized protein YqeY